MKNLILLYLSSLLIVACSGNDSSTIIKTEHIDSVVVKSDFKNDSLYFSLINTIESDSFLYEASSLEYLNSEGTSYFVSALVDDNNTISKLTNTVKDTNQQVIEEFYYLNSQKRVSSRIFTSYQTESILYEQVISFYDTEGKIIYTGSKTNNSLDQLENIAYNEMQLDINHNDQIAFDIIQQKGDFETNFRGFIELDTYNLNYIKVGSNDGNYSSLLAISKELPLLKKLELNETEYKGTPLRIEFTKIQRADGFSYQLLLDAIINQ